MKRVLAVILLLACILSLCGCKEEPKVALQTNDILAVCELSTLSCYYNNVVEYTKPADHFWQKARKVWVEYEALVTIGIDMTLVVIEINDTTVNITLPAAQILETKVITETLTEDSFIVSADRFLLKNKIDADEISVAIAKSQTHVEEVTSSNATLLKQAHDRAKELIENYINNFGEVTNQTFTIIWHDAKPTEATEPVTTE